MFVVGTLERSSRPLECLSKRRFGLLKPMRGQNCADSNGGSHVVHLLQTLGHLLILQQGFYGGAVRGSPVRLRAGGLRSEMRC